MKQKSVDYQYINRWLAEKGLHLQPYFTEHLRELTSAYKKRTALI